MLWQPSGELLKIPRVTGGVVHVNQAVDSEIETRNHVWLVWMCGCIALILDRILHERLGDKREPEAEPQHRDFVTNTIIVDLSSQM